MNFDFTKLNTSKPLTREQFQCFELAYRYMQSGVILGGNPHGENKHAETVTRNRAKTRIRIGI